MLVPNKEHPWPYSNALSYSNQFLRVFSPLSDVIKAIELTSTLKLATTIDCVLKTLKCIGSNRQLNATISRSALKEACVN